MLPNRLTSQSGKNKFFLFSKPGFTILEIMSIIAVVALLCAFALPGIMRLRINSNEVRAKAVLKSLATHFESYRLNSSLETYPFDLSAITDRAYLLLARKDIISGALSFKEAGFWFIYLPQTADAQGVISRYDIFAMPIEPNITGMNNYVMNEGGTVYIDNGRQPAAVDVQDTPVL